MRSFYPQRQGSRAAVTGAIIVIATVIGGAAAPAEAQEPAPASPAWSLPAGRGQVVVLRPAEVDEVTRTALARVTGELTAARFQVTVVPLDPATDPTPQVENVAPELQPVAAFAIAHAPGEHHDTLAIWVCDRLGQRVTIQRMTMHGGDISQDAELLALEAIELIRVSIAGLWPTHVRGPEPAAEAVSRPGARKTPELSVGLGVAMLQDVAVSETAWTGALNAMVKWPSGLAVRGELRGLGPAVQVAGSYGTATLRRSAAMLGGGWVFWAAERVRSTVKVAAGVEYLSASGAADDPARVHTATSWSTLLSGGIGAAARLNNVLALALDLDAVVTVPPTVLRIGDRDTQQLSQPAVLVTAGLQARF